VKIDAENTDGFFGSDIRNIGVHRVFGADNRDGSFADNFELTVLHDHRGSFVYADA
jgi:hypothetical protein